MLTNEARNTLNRFIASGKVSSVGFFGHTDQMGSAEYNDWLSVQRALAVKDYLLSKGLKEDNVSVVRGFGAQRLITTYPDSAAQQLNRRVAVTSGYKPTSSDVAAVEKQKPIYYAVSPSLPKLDGSRNVSPTDKKTNTASENVVAKTSPSNKTSEEAKSNSVENVSTKNKVDDKSISAIKNDATAGAKKTSTSNQKEAEIKTNVVDPSSTTTKSETAKAETTSASNEKNAVRNAAIPTQNTSTKTNEVPSKISASEIQPKNDAIAESGNVKTSEVTQGSFADKLSKAVSKPTASKVSTATSATVGKPNAPVVKEQKHEKLIEDIKDKSTKEGEHIVLRHINFYGGRHAFLPQSYPALDDLLETMQKVPTLQIEIQGHICCQEGEGDQIDFDSGEPVLSVTRAKAVYDFLLENGIDKKRMSYKGLAHKFPIIAKEANEEEATVNRRVEIKIIKK